MAVVAEANLYLPVLVPLGIDSESRVRGGRVERDHVAGACDGDGAPDEGEGLGRGNRGAAADTCCSSSSLSFSGASVGSTSGMAVGAGLSSG